MTPCLSNKWKLFYNFLTSSGGANMFSFGASQCADMIRFYGEVIEACQNVDSRDIVLKKFKGSLKELGKQLFNRSKDYQIQSGYHGGKGLQWTKPKIMTDPGERGRIRGLIGVKDGKVIDDYDYTDLKPPKPSDEDYHKKLEIYNWMKGLVDEFMKRRTATELRIAKMQGGARLWVHTEVDRIAKIDKVFGLSHGATISGTTTDNIFFFNRFSLVDRYLGEDPTVMDNRLDQFLLKKNRGAKIIIYYDSNGDYEGYFVFDPVKDQQWRAIAEVNQTMSDKFAHFKQYPTKDNVASLHHSLKESFEGLGSKKQREKFRKAKDFWQQRVDESGRNA